MQQLPPELVSAARTVLEDLRRRRMGLGGRGDIFGLASSGRASRERLRAPLRVIRNPTEQYLVDNAVGVQNLIRIW